MKALIISAHFSVPGQARYDDRAHHDHACRQSGGTRVTSDRAV
jgi:hypothetical protein